MASLSSLPPREELEGWEKRGRKPERRGREREGAGEKREGGERRGMEPEGW